MIDIGQYIEVAVEWLTENMSGLFDLIKNAGNGFIEGFEWILMGIPFYVIIALFSAVAYFKVSRSTAIFTVLGLILIYMIFKETRDTLLV